MRPKMVETDKNVNGGGGSAEEMAQWLGAHTALLEDLSFNSQHPHQAHSHLQL